MPPKADAPTAERPHVLNNPLPSDIHKSAAVLHYYAESLRDTLSLGKVPSTKKLKKVSEALDLSAQLLITLLEIIEQAKGL